MAHADADSDGEKRQTKGEDVRRLRGFAQISTAGDEGFGSPQIARMAADFKGDGQRRGPPQITQITRISTARENGEDVRRLRRFTQILTARGGGLVWRGEISNAWGNRQGAWRRRQRGAARRWSG